VELAGDDQVMNWMLCAWIDDSADQDVDELVRPAGTDIGGYLSLGYELLDEISITFGYPVRCQSSIDRVHPILGFDAGETV